MQWEDEYSGHLVTVRVSGDNRSGFTASYIATELPPNQPRRATLMSSLAESFPTEAEALAMAYEQARNAIDQVSPR